MGRIPEPILLVAPPSTARQGSIREAPWDKSWATDGLATVWNVHRWMGCYRFSFFMGFEHDIENRNETIQNQPVLSIKVFPLATEGYGVYPTDAHGERLEVPRFIFERELHFNPKWAPKSPKRRRKMQSNASLSWGLKLHTQTSAQKLVGTTSPTMDMLCCDPNCFHPKKWLDCWVSVYISNSVF